MRALYVYRMRGLVVTVALLVVAAANPRERRQTNDDCFWWETNCKDSGDQTQPEAPVDPTTESSVTGGSRINTLPEETSYTTCTNGRGKCVPYYLCKDGNIITDGAGLIDIRCVSSLSHAKCNGNNFR